MGRTTAAAAALWDWLLGRMTQAPRRLLVVGGGEATSRLIADLKRDRGVPFKVVEQDRNGTKQEHKKEHCLTTWKESPGRA